MNIETFPPVSPGRTLKEPTGWFAAGRSFRQALTLLSDGAFKLFAYLCLEADRRTGRFETTQRELAQALGKSKRAIGTYVRELDEQGICRTRPGRNQFAPTVFEITETYWPYQKPASGSNSSEETRYIDAVRQAFLAVVCASGKFTSADDKTARRMQANAVPLETVQDAILVGACRKYVSWLNGGPDQAIGTLSYFVPIVAEIRQQPISVDYRDYLRTKTESYGELWREGRRPPGSSAGG